MQACFEELLEAHSVSRTKAEDYEKISSEKFAIFSINYIWSEICSFLDLNIDSHIYKNNNYFMRQVQNTGMHIPSANMRLYLFEDLSDEHKQIIRELKRFITTGHVNNDIADFTKLRFAIMVPMCYILLKDYWCNPSLDYRNRNFHILNKFMKVFPDVFNPQRSFHEFLNILERANQQQTPLYLTLNDIFIDTKIVDHHGLADIFDQMLMTLIGTNQPINVITTGISQLTTGLPNYKAPLTLSINRAPSVTGKAAVNLLKNMTPEEKERHKMEQSKERNRRRQEKINALRVLDKLPTNREKIISLLHMYNPSITQINQDILEYHVKFLLDKFGLL